MLRVESGVLSVEWARGVYVFLLICCVGQPLAAAVAFYVILLHLSSRGGSPCPPEKTAQIKWEGTETLPYKIPFKFYENYGFFDGSSKRLPYCFYGMSGMPFPTNCTNLHLIK